MTYMNKSEAEQTAEVIQQYLSGKGTGVILEVGFGEHTTPSLASRLQNFSVIDIKGWKGACLFFFCNWYDE